LCENGKQLELNPYDSLRRRKRDSGVSRDIV